LADYIPRTETKLIPWIINFSSKLAVHGPAVGVTAGEITTVGTMSTMGTFPSLP
jgi:hypothetical protein